MTIPEITRLYDTDSTLTEFTAAVVAVEPADGRVAVRLARTAFYPTSGGQPNDTGSLGSGRVVDVVDREDATVWHLVEAAPALTVGETVHGRVDRSRRFDHMQQHSWQHVLSAAFARLCEARTVGVHLGERASTIDLDRPLSPEQVAAGESAANALIWDGPGPSGSSPSRPPSASRAVASRVRLWRTGAPTFSRPAGAGDARSRRRPDIGRGGGRPEIAQGGGLDADPDDVTELARRLLSQALG